MLTAFAFRNERLEQIPHVEDITQLHGAAWIDLINSTEEERTQVEAMYRQDLPEPKEMEEIEASARFFEDENGLHIHSLFLHEIEGRPRNTTVAFTLSGNRLFTVHDRDVPALRLLRRRVRRDPSLVGNAMSIMITLFQIKVDDLADVLEEVYTGLEATSRLVLEDEDASLEDALEQLASLEDLNGKVRLCLMDTQRALTFLLRKGRLAAEHAERVREILRDIDSLLPHSAFLFEKVNFLMDAAQNFTNIEQNQIIKTFSIAAVVFLPPTLIASIYGMNFQFMPELNWPWSYPVALVLMILSAITPYWYFKRKGWL